MKNQSGLALAMFIAASEGGEKNLYRVIGS